MFARHDAALFDQNPGPVHGEGHIPGGGDVEADGARGVLPGVAEVEIAEGRQLIDPAARQVGLVDDQHLGAQLGPPCELRGIGHAAVVKDPRLEHQDQVPGGGGEVMHIAGARQVDDVGRVQAAVGVQVPDHGLVAVQADVPDRAVGVVTGVGLEGHALEVVAQGDEALGRQVRGRHRHGRAAFPQGPDLVAGGHDGGVGGIGVVIGAEAGAGVAGGAEAGGDDGIDLRLPAALGRVGEAGVERDLALVDAEGAHQAVAVKPVGGRAAGPPELARAVAEQGAGQARRGAAVDQPHGPGRDVGLEVGGGQGPVGGHLHRGHGADGFRGDDGGREGGGPHQEIAAGRLHGRNPERGYGAASSSEPPRGERWADYLMRMVWAVSPATAKWAASQPAGPILPTALLEKA